MTEIILKNSFISLGILPDCGASLSFFKYKGQDVLRPALNTEMESNNTSMFVMIPYTSFITDGHFTYYPGITRSVPKNSPVSNWPIHGDIWRQKGTLLARDNNSITIGFDHSKKDGFPYDYEAKITYKLEDDKLQILLDLHNKTPLPMPYGLGLHPFFVCNKDTRLQYNAQNIWYCGDDPILGHPYQIPASFDFSKEKLIPRTLTDISVDGWDSTAHIIQKDYSIQISTDESFHHLILYIPKGKDYFCLEPVTHTPDAFNLASQGIIGTGIQSLGPHESVQNTITISVKGKTL